MSSNSVSISAPRFIVAPSQLLRENKNYLWVFMILLDKAAGSRSASISGKDLIRLSGLPRQEVRDSLHWLKCNGYVKKIISHEGSGCYLLSIEGSLPPDPLGPSIPPYVSDEARDAFRAISLPPVRQAGRKFIADPSDESLSIPPQLNNLASVICEFFNNHKGGAKTKRAFASLITSLIQIFEDKGGGIDAVKKQLEIAIERSRAGERKWDSITYSNWDRFGRQKQQSWEQNSRPSTQQIVTKFEEDFADH
jgi:hypothetical protein